MVSVRQDIPGSTAAHPSGRLRLLLSTAGWDANPWAEQLPRLLEPLGVQSLRARCAEEAATTLRSAPVDIAVVDLMLPMRLSPEQAGSAGAEATAEAGVRVLELLRRIERRPPVILVSRRSTSSQQARSLAAALTAGVFAVVERPVRLEIMLEALRRALARTYAGKWPDASEPAPRNHPDQPRTRHV